MANSDKNIVITPNINQAAQPNVVFKGQGNVPITLRVLDDSYGTLSFEGSAGQLFSINNNLTSGIIFSVNDVSGIPQIDVNADGTIRIAPFGSNLQIAGLTIGRGGGGIATNTAFGFNALAAITSGTNNTGIGYNSLDVASSGVDNTAVGSNALGSLTIGGQNSALGTNAGSAITTTSENVCIGYSANTTGNDNIVIGAYGQGGAGNDNIGIGRAVLYSATSGSRNVAVGFYALYSTTATSGNVAIGYNAARYTAGLANGIYIGDSSASGGTSSTNEIVIGYQATGKGSNTTVLGNTSTTQTWLYGSNRLPFNSASGLSTFNVAKTVLGGVHFVNGAGSGAFARNEAAITFQGTSDTEAQAGIYVTNDNSTGTHMAFATTDSYATGPQLAMTINNVGVVNFLRTQPTYTGSKIAYGSGTIGYLTKYFNDSSGITNSLIYDNGTNIGIGTTSPSAKLHVYSATAPQFRLEGTSDSILAFYRNNVYGGYIGLGSPGNNDIFIYNLNSGAVRINNADVYVSSTGNVGIGTTSPGAKLEIQTADGADSLAMSGYKVMKWESSNHLVYGGYTAGQWQILKFFTNGSERFRVDSVGNFGVGTTGPGVRMDVQGAGGSAVNSLGTATVRVTPDSQNTYSALELRTLNAGTYGGAGLMAINDTNYDSNLLFYTNPAGSTTRTERMRITKDGYVGIGLTPTTGDTLEVKDAIRIPASGYQYGARMSFWSGAGFQIHCAQANFPIVFQTAASINNNQYERMRITHDGKIGIGEASPNALLQLTTSASLTGQIIKAGAAQTAALQTFQNSSGEVIDFVAADGYSSLHFGEIDWTPNYSGGVSSPSARTYQKTSGNANTWDGQVYSSQGFIKNVHVTFKPSQSNLYFMMGLNSDPSTDGGYTSLDYAWFCSNDGYLYIYENGGQVGSNYGTYTSSTLLTLAYDGTNVTYYKDGAIMRQVARAVGNALYLDSSFYSLNAAANSVRFGPLAPNVAAQGTANYVAKFNAANSLVNSSIQDDGTTVTITNALVANSVATPRYYSYGITAGNAVRLGQWYVTEGNVALYIQVSSDTGGHSGTSSYLYQGGFNVISNTSGQYIKLLPLMIGRGHGDGPDNSISSDSGGWTVFLYTGSTNPAYTMGVAVGIPTGKTNKTLRITITELRGGMTYTADGSSISYPTTSYPYSYQHTYGNLYSNGPIQTAYGPYLGSSGYVSGGFVGVSKWLGLDGQYINIRRLYGVRSFPNTYANGDYVEIAQINRSGGAPITLTIHLGHGAVNGQASAIYQFVTPPFAAGSFTIPPVNYNTDGDIGFDIEAIVTNTYYLNIRARRRSSTTPTYLDFMFSIECHQFNRGGMTEISGTGNSASAIGYGDINQKIGPSVSSPPPAGGSGAGTNLTISASSGVTSGAGGSIILQPGAQATSGGDGQIIIRKSGTSDIGSIFPITNHSVGIQHGSGGTVGYVEIARQGYNGTYYLRIASNTTEGITGGATIWSNQLISLISGGTGSSDSDVPVAIYRRPLLFTYSNFTTTNFGAGLKGSLSNGVIRVCDGTGTTVDSGAGGSLAFASSTASYSANQNDLALTGSAFQRLSAAGGLDRTITGIAPPSGGSHVDGRMMRIYNVGSANSLILAHNSTSSAANNRLWCVGQANITIALGDYAELIYDANDNGRGGAGWRVH